MARFWEYWVEDRRQRTPEEILARRWTPEHSFDLKTPEGRALRQAQLQKKRREVKAELISLEAAAKIAKKHNTKFRRERIRLLERLAGNPETPIPKRLKRYGTPEARAEWIARLKSDGTWGEKHADTPLIHRWAHLRSQYGQLSNYLKVMIRADRGAEARKRRKRRRDRERAREEWARERRRERDRAMPKPLKAELDARNARRRARYAARKAATN